MPQQTINQAEAMHEMVEALKAYSTLVQVLLDSWVHGDLAAAVNSIEDHRDETDLMLTEAGL
jgi:hypothetical protein